jgi:sphinganine-1-phosphate aldolase
MQDAVRSHPSLRIMGAPSFLFSFTSDEFDVYHVNDFLRTRGWRLNGQQYPNALHMAVTRPQTQPGVVERWRATSPTPSTTRRSTATNRPSPAPSTAASPAA